MYTLPLTTDICIHKIKLVCYTIRLSTQNMEFDVWFTVIIILIISWVLTIWKTAISFIVWCFIIWVYNLDDNLDLNFNHNSNNCTNSNYSVTMSDNYNNSKSSLKSSLNSSTINSSNSFNEKNFSNTIGYINLLEKKIIDLEKSVTNLENDKLQQNIIIYTFNHKINEKIDNLEKKFNERSRITHNELNQIYKVLISLKQRKTIRFGIFKMYLKKFLVLALPDWQIKIMKTFKNSLKLFYKRSVGIVITLYNNFNSFNPHGIQTKR